MVAMFGLVVALSCAASVAIAAPQLPTGTDGWVWQNPWPQGNHLNSVHFVSLTTGWTVGDNGTILKTTDAGTTWTAQASGTWQALSSVHFVSATTGWAVGMRGTILKTTDGGTTWTAQDSGTSEWIHSVHFVSATTGWAVGTEGTNLKTTDGGTTWTAGTWQALSSVHFVSATTGWAVGMRGTAVGMRGMILKTTDGGTTWTAQDSGTSEWIHSVHFVSATTGWVVGGSGSILKTSDGGTTWIAQSSGTTQSLGSVHFVSATTGWVVGSSGSILKTSDGGTTWIAQSSGTTQSLGSVHFVSPSTGWVVGSSGSILKTSDGGTTWTAQDSGTSEWIKAVHFVSATTGWVVAGAGTILKTIDGGTTWIAQDSGTSERIQAVHFVSATTGWVVGSSGSILKTSDGGTTWIAQSSGTKQHLNSVDFVSATTGWAVGDGGTILRTTDGGASWTAQAGFTQQFNAVHSISATSSWVVGSGGTILGARVDTVPPIVSCNPLLSQLDAAQIDLWAADSGGIGSIQYTLDDEPTVTITPTIINVGNTTARVNLVSLGAHVLRIWATDVAGNRSDPIVRSFSIVDNTAISWASSAGTAGFRTPAFGVPVNLVVLLSRAGQGSAVVGESIVFERLSGVDWITVSTVMTDKSGVARYSVLPYLASRTSYRARFEASGPYRASAASQAIVTPAAYLSAAKVATSVMSKGYPAITHGKSYTVSAYLKPKHTAGTYPVKLKVYYSKSGKWVLYKTISAKASNYSSYSKVSCTIKVPSGGKYWHVRFEHPADSANALGKGTGQTVWAK